MCTEIQIKGGIVARLRRGWIEVYVRYVRALSLTWHCLSKHKLTLPILKKKMKIIVP